MFYLKVFNHYFINTSFFKKITNKKNLLLFYCVLFFLGACSHEAEAKLYINEIMASNSEAFADDDGDYEDWIEIYNAGSLAVNLKGYGLSDDPENLYQWKFPDVTIRSKGYMLVWASGKNRHYGQLHTNFRISLEGEEIILTDPQGNRVDHVHPVYISTDVSYGRKPDGSNNWRYFYESTPNASNTTQGLKELISPPSFSAVPGRYSKEFNLAIKADLQKGGKILYTLDGSEPRIENVNDSLGFKVNYYDPEKRSQKNILRHNKTYIYKKPIKIVQNPKKEYKISDVVTTYFDAPDVIWQKPEGEVVDAMTIRARVHHETAQSDVATGTYLIGDEKTNFPAMYLTINPEHLIGYSKGIYVPGHTYFINEGTHEKYPDDDYGNFFLEGRDWEKKLNLQYFNTEGKLEFNQNIGMRIHGGSLQRKPLKPFRLYSRDDYDDGSDMDYPFIPDALHGATNEPVGTYQRILIRSSGNLMDHLYDVTAPLLMSPSKVGVQLSQPIIHYFNDEYWGLIYLRCRYDRYHIANTFGLRPRDVVMLNAPRGRGRRGDVDEGRSRDVRLYRNFFNYAVKRDLSNSFHYEQVSKMFDVLGYIDYYAMFIILNNYDWYGRKHFRVWRSRQIDKTRPFHDGKWRFLAWDFDIYGELEYVDYNLLADALHPKGKGGQHRFDQDPRRTKLIINLLESSIFKNLFINRFADLMNTFLHPDRFEEVILSEYEKISPELERHEKRWGIPASSIETANELIEFGKKRPDYIREHLIKQFNLDGVAQVSIDVTDSNKGQVRINTVTINALTPGIKEPVYPWRGLYFKNVPVELEAIPAPGYRFVRWKGLPEGTPEITIYSFMKEKNSIKAVFESTGLKVPVYVWDFNQLPEGEFYTVFPSQAFFGETQIVYAGSGEGYMDRVEEGSKIGALPGAKAGWALRVRNPSYGRSLIFNMPTTGYEKLEFSYATRRTSSGASFQNLYYRVSKNEKWKKLLENIEVEEQFKRVSVSFSEIAEVGNNPDFAIKIDFDGDTVKDQNGNNRFDNFILTGIAKKN